MVNGKLDAREKEFIKLLEKRKIRNKLGMEENKVIEYNSLDMKIIEDYFKSIKTRNVLMNDFGCFDIETSTIDFKKARMEVPVIYSWAFQIGGYTILGRRPSEYVDFIPKLKAILGKNKLIIFVHDLSFEVTFLRNMFPDGEEFRLKSTNRCLSFTDENIKYMCSFLLSGKSLKEFTKGCEHEKKDGYNHDIIRYHWTKLTEDEVEYITNDVLGLREAILRLMKAKGLSLSDLESIKTKSGFARKLLKSAFKKYKVDKNDLNLPSYECVDVLKMAVHGGNICPARKYKSAFYEDEVEDIMLHNVHSVDAKKFYTSVLISKEFPIGNWKHYKNITKNKLFSLKNTAFVAKFVLKNVKLKNENEHIPYIIKSKTNYKNANWWLQRLISADEIALFLTDVDYKIIDKMYSFDVYSIDNCWTSNYGKLPNWIRNTVKEQYLKVAYLDKQSVEYDVEKIILNSISGTFGQDRQKGKTKEEFNDDMRNYIFNYAWYVWATAWGRYQLQQVIDIAGDKAVYVGVDSIKTLGPVDFSKHNEKCFYECDGTMTAEEMRSKDYNVVGCFIKEYIAKRFKVINKVMYCCEFEESIEELSKKGIAPKITKDDRQWAIDKLGFTDEDFNNFNILITVAGVNKMKGSMELYKKGGIESFKKGFEFTEVPRTEMEVLSFPLNSIPYGKNEIEVCGGTLIKNKSGFILGEESLLEMSLYEFEGELEEVIDIIERTKRFF